MKYLLSMPILASILILGSVGLTQDILTQAFAGTDPADIVYENGNPNPSNGLYMDMAITANDFVLDEDLELTDVHFILQDDSGNGLNVPIQYEIRSNDVNMPTVGAPLFSGTGINLDTEQIEDGPFGPRLLVWFDFEDPVPLSGGVTYWLVLHAGNDINDNTVRGFFWEASDVDIGFTAVSSINGVPVPDELFDTWFQLTSKQTSDGKVTICHKPGTPAEKTKEVPESAVAGHLGHGDFIGTCDAS